LKECCFVWLRSFYIWNFTYRDGLALFLYVDDMSDKHCVIHECVIHNPHTFSYKITSLNPLPIDKTP